MTAQIKMGVSEAVRKPSPRLPLGFPTLYLWMSCRCCERSFAPHFNLSGAVALGSAGEELATVSSLNWVRPLNRGGHPPPPPLCLLSQIKCSDRTCWKDMFPIWLVPPLSPSASSPPPSSFLLSPSPLSASVHVSDSWLILQRREGGWERAGEHKRWMDKSSLYSFPGK